MNTSHNRMEQYRNEFAKALGCSTGEIVEKLDQLIDDANDLMKSDDACSRERGVLLKIAGQIAQNRDFAAWMKQPAPTKGVARQVPSIDHTTSNN